jgi:signal transduction histidine kinase
MPVEGDVPRIETLSEGEVPPPPSPSDSSLEEVEVPIGDLGTLVIGLSEEEVQKRIGVLRRDLIRQTSVIALLTVTLLSVAFVAAWKLFHRARQSEEQALEAERLAYIGTLASGLAHEIRNPLNSLSLNMQMLEEESRQSGSESSQLRLLSLTRTELARLERLATDFLSYAKPRALELRAVPVVELLERVLAVLAAEAHERRAEVEIEDRSHGAEVEVDRGQINQLLLNLAQNALAAAAEGEDPPEVRLVARREEDEVVIEIHDNGPGIAAEERERIFDLFYSTRKGGTGLGLAIVQRIARAHGTEVEVGGEPGSGAVMSLRLPVAEEREETPARAASVAG